VMMILFLREKKNSMAKCNISVNNLLKILQL
jgi:hypothetical protein